MSCPGRQWKKSVKASGNWTGWDAKIYVGPEDQTENNIPQENLEGTPFTKAIRNAVGRGAPMSLRSSVRSSSAD